MDEVDGVVILAETYEQLQGIPHLRLARKSGALRFASPESTHLAVVQAAEISMWNLADLYTRAANDVKRGAVDGAATKMAWSWGFHGVLTCLGEMRHQLPPSEHAGTLELSDSPAFRAFQVAHTAFDTALLTDSAARAEAIEGAVSQRPIASPLGRLLHLSRLSAFQITIWFCDLDGISTPVEHSSFAEAIGSDHLHEAVWGLRLAGDTFLTQFRGLHQVPELLAMQAADLIEETIRRIRDCAWEPAAELLGAANTLTTGVLRCLQPLIENLSLADYHEIRAHLHGITSGMHSVAIHYHLFGELYFQLAEALVTGIAGANDVEQSARQLSQQRFDSPWGWVKDRVVNECLRYRHLILAWRDHHLHLPRITLGSDGTKSLTGAPDAVIAVDNLRRAFWQRDPLRAVAQARGLNVPGDGGKSGDSSIGSLDHHVMSVVGRLARQRFPEVQQRTGPFAAECPFRPPSPRRA